MSSHNGVLFGKSYNQLMKGNFRQSVSIFTKLMSDNNLEILDLAESENDTFCATRRCSTLSQSNTSLSSNTSAASLFSATSATSDTNTSCEGTQLSVTSPPTRRVSERGYLRANRLKRVYNEAVRRRQEQDPLSKEHCKHLKQSLVIAINKLHSLPDQSDGYLEAAAVMCLLSQWNVAEEIYEIGIQRCQYTTNQMLYFQLDQLRAINRHISDTLTLCTNTIII
ncbi:hypothetical protein LOD99_3825 [Oopsacas minuta]|uniref:Uncharacterized protein n=1 Tax=Oopsacas minuta TaxID=111878 RepID=A0AAV7JWL2_9METZ|nr:hypothetical protein LOD99_3824 [Oopsacas minuta]KAI6653301.1 hypothetical protein LOD99_3825 [Oopsacas minuta]